MAPAPSLVAREARGRMSHRANVSPAAPKEILLQNKKKGTQYNASATFQLPHRTNIAPAHATRQPASGPHKHNKVTEACLTSSTPVEDMKRPHDGEIHTEGDTDTEEAPEEVKNITKRPRNDEEAPAEGTAMGKAADEGNNVIQRIPQSDDATEVATTEEKVSDDGINKIIRIWEPPDLILEVSQETTNETVLYSVDSGSLIAASNYFDVLLNTQNFQEGIAFAKRLEELSKTHRTLLDIPPNELPRVQITDIGDVRVKSIVQVMTHFLQALHDQTVVFRKPPLTNLANLAVVADRFDATETVSAWAQKHIFKNRNWQDSLAEVTIRQHIFITLMFNRVTRADATRLLVLRGSVMWDQARDVSTGHDGPWWDLPRGIEEELQFRRNFILETLSSLHTYVLDLYTSGAQMCKLGYDTSPACDSFQFGQHIRHLKRRGLLDLPATYAEAPESTPYTGDIGRLLENLRDVRTLQLDRNHAHCGPKNLLQRALDFIELKLDEESISVCLNCLNNPNLPEYLWTRSKAALLYDHTLVQWVPLDHPPPCGRSFAHEKAKELFMAKDKNWGVVLANWR